MRNRFGSGIAHCGAILLATVCPGSRFPIKDGAQSPRSTPLGRAETTAALARRVLSMRVTWRTPGDPTAVHAMGAWSQRLNQALALKAADQPVKVECQVTTIGTQPSPAGRRPSKPRPWL